MHPPRKLRLRLLAIILGYQFFSDRRLAAAALGMGEAALQA
jgi:hypothetical protein